VRPADGEDALELRVWNTTPAALLQVTSSVRRIFDLAADPSKISLAFESDPLLGPLVKRRPGLRIPGAWDPFEFTVRAILGQQVSVSTGRTLVGRIVVRCGRPIPSNKDGFTHFFPTPADLASANLDGLGLTRVRIDALRELAVAITAGRFNFAGSTEEICEALAALTGIGTWTAQYVALRALYEPDAFPASDLVLRRAAATNGASLPARVLEERAEDWRPWRGYAAMHLWCSSIGRYA
jgi:AraC family transcriptional regulator of adaptative response / DNA-3-methyladenine glycosylase II